MKEFIIRYWLEVIFSGIALGLSVSAKCLWNKFKNQTCENEAMKLGIQALLRDRIIHAYNKYYDLGYMPIYAKENVEAMYKQYKALGGNGTITKLIEVMDTWPTEPKEERKNA